MDITQLQETMPWLIPAIVIAGLWELVWKLLALWRSARKGQVAWFICLAIFNTVGILPIIYLLITRAKPVEVPEE